MEQENTRAQTAKKIAAKIGKGGLWLSAWGLILVVPILIVFSYFPLWAESTRKTVSGLSVILMAVVMLVAWKFVKPRVPPNVSFLVWLFIFYGITLGILCAIKAIIADIISTLFLSACSTVTGAVLYILWEALKDDDDEKKDGESK
jgi:hypothetical protein